MDYFIKQALHGFDWSCVVVEFILSNFNYKIVTSTSSNQRNVIYFYKIHDTEFENAIFSSEYEYIAGYHGKTHVWAWAWHISLFTNVEKFLARKLLAYATSLSEEYTLVQNILTTSRSNILEPIQLYINLAIGCKIIKNRYVLPINIMLDDDSLIYYIVLANTDYLDVLFEKLNGFKPTN
jgi:hypothetical protein